MSDNSNQENATAENDDFPSDYIEYYYRCKIFDIENGSKQFYYVVNTIIHNYEEIAKSEKFEINVHDNQNDLSGFGFISQLIKYNRNFHKISQKLISKKHINSTEEYRNNLNLLLKISNETILYISDYFNYQNKKVRKLKLNKLTFQSGSEYKKYNISDIKRKCQFEKKKNQKNKKIKFKEILSDISNISYIIGSDESDAIIDSILFNLIISILYIVCIILCFLIMLFVMALICGLLYYKKIDILFLFETPVIYYVMSSISTVLALTLCEKFWSPIRLHIERRKKSYNQSKNYVINLKDKKKIKWSAVWSLAKEIILAHLGSQ